MQHCQDYSKILKTVGCRAQNSILQQPALENVNEIISIPPGLLKFSQPRKLSATQMSYWQ